jgi:hypothetical protein
VLAAIVSSAGVPFLLPTMLDRFFILADVLAFLYALARPSKRSITAAVLIQIGSAFPVLVREFLLQPLDAFAAPFMLGGLVLLAASLANRPLRFDSRGVTPPEPAGT